MRYLPSLPGLLLLAAVSTCGCIEGEKHEPFPGWTWVEPVAGMLWYATITGTSDDDVWAGGSGNVVYHWDGKEWRGVSTGLTGIALLPNVHGLWAVGRDSVWAAGDYFALTHWNGKTWERATPRANDSANSVWGAGENDLWATAYPSLLHWDGETWTLVRQGTHSLHSILGGWVVTPNDQWAFADDDVRSMGSLHHWDGEAWTKVKDTDFPLTAMWGSGANDIWALGRYGRTEHWDGQQWVSSSMLAAFDAASVAGTGPNDVWAVGTNSATCNAAIAHWDGHEWTVTDSHNEYRLTDVWISPTGAVWVTTDQSEILHRPAPRR